MHATRKRKAKKEEQIVKNCPVERGGAPFGIPLFHSSFCWFS
jgi:hypothetical protein